MRKGKQEGWAREAGVGTARHEASVVIEGAYRLAEAAPSSEARGESLQGHPPCPMHLQPSACQATGSIMNEASLITAGKKTGQSGFPPGWSWPQVAKNAQVLKQNLLPYL